MTALFGGLIFGLWYIQKEDSLKVYLAASQTGGVGKSTFSWALAHRIAKRFPGKRVLFIDQTKSQGTRSMRVAPINEIEGRGLGKALNAVFGVILPKVNFSKQLDEIEVGLERARKIVQESVVTIYGDPQKSYSIDVLPAASATLSAVVAERWHEPEPGTVLGALLAKLDGSYDYCVIDPAPDIECKSVRSAMKIADAVVSIQSVNSEDTIQGVAQFIGAIEDTNATWIGFVANLLDTKRRESKDALGVIAEACREGNHPLLHVVRNLGGIQNSTRVRSVTTGKVLRAAQVAANQSDLMSGLYAEYATEPSVRSSVEFFETVLDDLLDRMEDPSKSIPIMPYVSDLIEQLVKKEEQ